MTAGDPAPTQPPVDRTEELVLAMLARRANRPAPEWLAGRIMEAVASSQQARTGRSGRPAVLPGPRGRWALAGVAAVLLTAAVGVGYLSGGRLGTPAASDGSSDMAAGPSGSLASGVGSPVTPTPATATAPMTGGDPEGDLTADTLAVVTKAGKNLLVRSAPGKGEDSEVYSPALPSGTRLLILGGPVAADGLEWYRVLTDGKTMRDGKPIRRYGWVARGEAGETWIKPAAPACWRSLNAATLNALSRVDLLTCYHDTALTIRGRWRPLDPGEAGVAPCDWVTGPCNPREEWLLNPFARITFQADDGTDGEVDVAVPPEMRARLEAVPQDTTMTATIAMDRPEAPSCSVGDPGDNSADSAVDRAVAACQVRFALQDVTWNDGSVTARSIARVRVDSLPIRTAPGSDIRVPGRALRAGDRVLVAEGPRQVEGIDWFAVAWEDNDSLYGWVPATVKSKPTLAVQHTECPSLGDWQAYVELRWWERLACFGDEPVTVDMWLRMTTPYPDKSLACGYWAMKSSTNQEGQPVVPVSRCLAEPGWLAGISGLEGRRPGGASLKLAYDPATVDIAALDATPRWVRVTGAFSNPGSSACRTTDRATGIDLVDPAEAALYCESVFVVTAIAPPAGPEPE